MGALPSRRHTPPRECKVGGLSARSHCARDATACGDLPQPTRLAPWHGFGRDGWLGMWDGGTAARPVSSLAAGADVLACRRAGEAFSAHSRASESRERALHATAGGAMLMSRWPGCKTTSANASASLLHKDERTFVCAEPPGTALPHKLCCPQARSVELSASSESTIEVSERTESVHGLARVSGRESVGRRQASHTQTDSQDRSQRVLRHRLTLVCTEAPW